MLVIVALITTQKFCFNKNYQVTKKLSFKGVNRVVLLIAGRFHCQNKQLKINNLFSLTFITKIIIMFNSLVFKYIYKDKKSLLTITCFL